MIRGILFFILDRIFPIFGTTHRMSLRDKGETEFLDDQCSFCGTSLRIAIDDKKKELVCYCYRCEQIVEDDDRGPDDGISEGKTKNIEDQKVVPFVKRKSD